MTMRSRHKRDQIVGFRNQRIRSGLFLFRGVLTRLKSCAWMASASTWTTRRSRYALWPAWKCVSAPCIGSHPGAPTVFVCPGACWPAWKCAAYSEAPSHLGPSIPSCSRCVRWPVRKRHEAVLRTLTSRPINPPIASQFDHTFHEENSTEDVYT